MSTIPLTDRIVRARQQQLAADLAGDPSWHDYWTRQLNRLIEQWADEHAAKETV